MLKIFYLFQDLVVSIVVKIYKDMLDFMSGSKISAVIGTVLLIIALPVMTIWSRDKRKSSIMDIGFIEYNRVIFYALRKKNKGDCQRPPAKAVSL